MYLSPKERKSALRSYWTIAIGAWSLPLIILAYSFATAESDAVGIGPAFTEVEFFFIAGLLGSYALALALIYGFGLIIRSVFLLHEPYDEASGVATGHPMRRRSKTPGQDVEDVDGDEGSGYRGRRASE